MNARRHAIAVLTASALAIALPSVSTARAANPAPSAKDDRYEIEATPTNLRVNTPGVLRNDLGTSGVTAVRFTTTAATQGGVTGGPNDGSFDYSVPANNILDSFTYTFAAGGVTSNVATVKVKIGNRTPIPAQKHYSVEPGRQVVTPAGAGLLIGAVDLDEDSLTVGGNDSDPGKAGVQVRTICGGTATIASDGGFVFDPGPVPPLNDPLDCRNKDEFQYDVLDGYTPGGGQTGRASADATIEFKKVPNRPPVANDDTYRGPTNTRVRAIDPTGRTPAADGVLVNDTDPDRDALVTSAETIITAEGGRAVMQADGTFNYDPPTGFNGLDSFTYTAREASTTIKLSDTAVASLLIGLIARDDAYSMNQGTSLSPSNGVLANDEANPDPTRASNPLEVAGWRWVSNPGSGHTLTVEKNGTFTYTPPPTFFGNVGFEYDVKDASGAASSAIATIGVKPAAAAANRPPVAADHQVEAIYPGNVSRRAPGVLANATDPDGDSVRVSSTTRRATREGGTVTVQADGGYVYEPPSVTFVGADSFTYDIADGRGGKDSGKVTVDVRRGRTINDACPAGRVPPAGYRDVDGSSAHAAAINCVAWWRVTSNATRGTVPNYRPESPVTRAQMASFISNLLDRTRPGLLGDGSTDMFDDDNGNIHERNINRLAAAGVVRGTGPRAFSPDAFVTRAQMATFLANALRLGAAPRYDYFDDDASNAHQSNINRVASLGIASGTGDRQFNPDGLTRRDQMASFIARALDWSVEQGRGSPPS